MTHWGAPGRTKFYEGSPKDSIWNNMLMSRAMNASESKFLMDIASNSHSSQKILRDPLGPVPSMDMEGGRKRTSRSHRSGRSGVSQTVDDLKDFNNSLRNDLNDLKSYLLTTNQRLENLQTQRSGRSSTQRSRTSLGHSEPGNTARSSALSSARSRSTAQSTARKGAKGLGATATMSSIPEIEDYDPQTDPTRRKSARIKGYRIGHEVEMQQHSNGNRFPTIGPGSVTESHTNRRNNMLKEVQKNPVVPDDDGNKRMFLNNMFMEDPSQNSNNWQPMFRHDLKTFVNKHDCNIPYHTGTFVQV